MFLLALIAVAGGMFGIAGFMKAREALADIAGLRQQIAALRQQVAGNAPAPPPAVAPLAPSTIWGRPPPALQTQAVAAPAPLTESSAVPSPGADLEAIATPAPITEPPAVPPPGPDGEAIPAPAPITEPPRVASPGPDLEAVAASAPITEPPRVASPGPDLEAILTTRWGTWIGAAALLMAGVFLVRYAVEHALLGPETRCVLAALLGCALIAGAEWLRRHAVALPGWAEDQAPAALAAGGVAVLFAAAYGAGPLFDLVPPVVGFALMAAASLAGLALSLRHGQLIAAVGIVGAFVTPALVQVEHPSWPGLFLYLLCVLAAALAVVRYTAWIWLGWASATVAALWLLPPLLDGTAATVWPAALFVPAAAALHLYLLPPAALDHPVGRRLAWVPCAALGVGGLLLAWVYQGWDTRIALLLLAPLTLARAVREPRLRWLPCLAATLFLLLLATWSVQVTQGPDIATPARLWTPDVVRDLLGTASLLAGLFAAAGVWQQRRSATPLPWAALAAATPVLALTVCYWRVAAFETRADWAIVAFALAAGLIGLTAWSMRQSRALAGVHAAAAVAALALACAMLLTDQWLTIAISLFLPGLAWVEARADLPALRRVGLAVAGLVVVRLLFNPYMLGYAFGPLPAVTGLLPSYGVPAAAFALAAFLFLRRGDDLLVGVLEVGATGFATALVALEVRRLAGGAHDLMHDRLIFQEAALHLTALALLAAVTLRIAARLNRPMLLGAGQVLGGIALACGVMLLLGNPVVTGDPVGTWPLLDWLLPGYLLPGAISLLIRRHPVTAQPPALRPVLAGYGLVAGFAWMLLEIRHLFHGNSLAASLDVEPGELWAWSGGALAYGGGLLVAGLRQGSRVLRLSGIAVLGLTAGKVFIIDMGGLEGLWRVLSFLGLGLALIGFAAIYRRMAGKPGDPRQPGR